MKWMGKHLNWTYGIALIIGLLAFIWFVFTKSTYGYIGYIIYIAIIWIGAGLVAWRKNNWEIVNRPYWLIPPLVAIIALCSSNRRTEKVKQPENSIKSNIENTDN